MGRQDVHLVSEPTRSKLCKSLDNRNAGRPEHKSPVKGEDLGCVRKRKKAHVAAAKTGEVEDENKDGATARDAGPDRPWVPVWVVLQVQWVAT